MLPSAAPSVGASAGSAPERVKLQNSKGESVPFHAAQGDSAVSARVAVGTEVSVLETGADGRWLRVRAPDGTEGWNHASLRVRGGSGRG